jgi:hypothetical protein
MADNFATYLKSLGTDAAALKTFQADPHAAMTKAGLTPEQIKAVQSKNVGSIKQGLGAKASENDIIVIIL